MYSLFRYTSWYGYSYQQSQVCRLGRLDSRADDGMIYLFFSYISLIPITLVNSKMGKPSRKSLLGGPPQTGPSSSRTVNSSSPVILLLFLPFFSKMESFIRSKYESRRWALDGPPPADPSVLENGHPSEPPPQQQEPMPPPRTTNSTSIRPSATTIRQPQTHQLLSSNYASRSVNPPAIQPAATAQPSPVTAPPPPVNDLFSLDFHAPAPAINNNNPAPEQKKDVKQDILSLFSATSTPQMGNQAAWGGAAFPQQQQQQQMTGMMGMNGTGMWGATSGWTPVVPAQSNVWDGPSTQHQQQSNLFNSTAVWGNSTAAPAPDSFTTTPVVQKKDDVFGDIWGGFK